MDAKTRGLWIAAILLLVAFLRGTVEARNRAKFGDYSYENEHHHDIEDFDDDDDDDDEEENYDVQEEEKGANACGLLEDDGTTRIVGGREAYPGEYPFVVRIRGGLLNTRCTGSIIGPNAILTAAHCFVVRNKRGQLILNVEPEGWYVVAGETQIDNYEDGKRNYTIKLIHVNSKYDIDKEGIYSVNDIAILILDEQIEFSNGNSNGFGRIKQIDLPAFMDNTYHEKGRAVMLAGWGRLNRDTENSPEFALKMRVYATELATCKPHPLVPLNYYDQYLCTAKTYGGVCKGDSGGPMFVELGRGKFLQIGIISFAPDGCAVNQSYFSKVNYFTDWIQDKLKAS